MSRTNIENIHPLSPMQEGMLFDTLYAAGSGAYVIQTTWTLRGRFDAPAFLAAWQDAVDRHGILRTGFAWDRLERPVQIVRKKATLPVHHDDLRALSPAEQERAVEAYAASDRARGFDLTRPPLMRVALFRLADDVFRVVWTRHHILLDGWSQPLLVKDVLALYDARVEGRAPPADRPRPFGDYIAWIAKQPPAAGESFWRPRLAGFAAPTPLHVDHPAAQGSVARFEAASRTLPDELSAELTALARKLQVTPSTVVQGAWAVLLSRYSGERDVLFGATVSGRSAPIAGIDTMIGMFINTLPVRVDVDPAEAARAFLARLGREQIALRDHEHSALVELQGLSQVPRGTPLFETAVVFENYPVEEALRQDKGGFRVTEARSVGSSTVPLTLVAVARRALTLTLSYDARRFDAPTIERMLGHLATILGGIAAGPETRLQDLPLLDEAERRQILVDWNATGAGDTSGATVPARFAAQAAATPEATAVALGSARISYRELDARSNQLAHRLRALGVGPEVLVGLCLHRSLDLVVGVLGILKAGGAYVPLDPSYPAPRLAWMLEDAGAKVVVAEERTAALAEGRVVVRLDTERDALAALPSEPPGVAVDPASLAYVIYTSGSTGKPKGVLVHHRGLASYVGWALEAYSVASGDGAPVASSIAFDLTVTSMLLPLLAGKRVLMIPEEGELEALAAALSEGHGFSLVKLTPAHLPLLSRLVPPEKAAAATRAFVIGGEALTWEALSFWREHAPATRLFNEYGPTETVVGCAVYDAARPGDYRGPVPIGRPIARTQLYVLDANGQPVPIGVPGELYIGGAGVARGYLNRPELTAERFVRDPFAGDERARLYRTGDLCRWLPSGDLEFMGRLDQQVKVRGYRIELGEIEGTLLGCAKVREAVVLAREDTPGDRRLCAYVVPSGEPAPTAAELHAFLSERLPEPMVPAAFVVLAALPLTPNGKVDRKALPAPDTGALAVQAYVAPRGPVEEALASIFAEVLRLPPSEIGAHDGFFALGGHSLLATQAISRIRAALGADLPLRALFEAPTPAALAERIAATHAAEAAPPVVPVPRGPHAPLSFGQERLWFLAQLDPGDASYNVPLALRIDGPLDAGCLQRAINAVVARHEVLRTTFVAIDGKPAGVVHPSLEIPLPNLDLSAMPGEARDAALREAMATEARTPFDLARGPLVRTRLVVLAEDAHVLLVTFHHVVADAWTLGVWNREISALYDAFRRGVPSPLPPLAVQYADHAAWQRAWLSGPVLDRELGYWKAALDGAPRTIDLPTDRPRPAVRTSRGDRRVVSLSPELTSALRDLARREGVTLYMLLLAALDLLLYRYTGQADVVVGSPIAGRTRGETEGLVGFFLNTLVLRTQLSEELTVRELLARVKAASLGAFAHQDLPFERLVQEIEPERDMSRSPLFQVVFNLQNAPREAMRLGDAVLRTLPPEGFTTKYDLTLILVDGPRSIGGSFLYSTDLFDAATAARMVASFEVLLERIAKSPDRRLGEIDILPPAERALLLDGWNDTRLELPVGETLVDLFDAQADRTPDAPALVAGGERLTFRQLDARANRIAHHLQKRGVGPDVVVGLAAGRTADLIAGLLGILKAGGAYLPIDPTYPVTRIEQMLGEAHAPVLLADASLGVPAAALDVEVVRLDAGAFEAEPASRPENEAGPEHLAYVLFTSGSTGRPKGVAVEHRQLVSYVRGIQARLALPETARWAHVSTFSADLGNTALFPPLCSGGTLHVIAEALTTDPAGLAAYFAREGIEALKIVPSHLAALLAAPRPEQALPSKILVLGGEASSWELIERIERLAPGCRIFNHYGPTETTVGAVAYPVPPPGARPPTPIVPLGRPLPNARVYLLDPSMSPVPLGAPGEVYIGGAGVARGYLGRPDLTAERFVKDPFREGGSMSSARLYRTGDRARYLPDGSLLFLGRTDFQVKIRGFRIELGEIEAALLAHPTLAEAVVLAQEDTPGAPRLVAYVVPRGGGTAASYEGAAAAFAPATAPAGEEVAAYLAERLPGYMVPSSFVVLSGMPLTPNGKIDRRALPALEPRRTADEDTGAPRTPVEEVLASIWADVFGRARVGVHERFGDLGGHSLLAIQIIARARDAFQVDIPLRAIFEAPTIATLAERVDQAARESEGIVLPPIAPAPRTGPLPLSFAQERLWFLNRLEPNSSFYNVPFNMRLSGPLGVPALTRALGEVVRRHEVLRTTFETVDGKSAQIVRAALPFALPVEDLADLPPDARDQALRRAAADEVQRPFDLARGPLIRGRLVRLGPAEHVLLLVAHHIVSDAWTRGILYRELSSIYDAFVEGRASPLPPLPIQYADYAVWQRRWLEGAVGDAQMAYWKQRLAGAPPVLELPTDRPRPPVQSYRGAWKTLLLSGALAASLKELSRTEGVTLFMTLLAAFAVLLQRTTGQDDLVVGTPVAGRSRPETEGLIGFFINTLVLRTTLSDEMPFRELLHHVREVCLGAYAHQDTSFERLVQELSPERDLARAPLFQVLFTLQDPPRPPRSKTGLAVTAARAENPTSKYDITLALSERDEGLLAAIEYATDLFDGATIERTLLHYRTVLQGAAAHPDAPLFQLPLLTADEERRILVDFNRPVAPLPPIERAVHHLFEDQAARIPEATAVVFQDRRLTYRELNERSNRVAHYLQKLGVGPDVLVGLCVPRSPEMVIGILGILKAGGAYVPLDPSYPIERLAWMLEDSAVPVVLTVEPIADELPVAGMLVRLDADAEAIDTEPAVNLDPAGDLTNLAYIIYTSGSTGKPKGVMIHHRGLAGYVTWAAEAYGAASGRGAPVHSSVSFDLTITGLFTPLVTGREVVLLPEQGEIEALVHVLAEPGGFSLVKITPAHLELLAQLLPPEKAAGAAGALVIGGEALSWETLAFFRKHAPRTRLINEYGPTETVVGCSIYDAAREGDFAGQVPIGRPIAGARLYILDRHRQPVPLGAPGELYIGGPGVARGYLNRPDLTEERFVSDPFVEDAGARMYKTGDLARHRADGEIEFLGRLDHQVKIRGFRIELGEIEAALAQYAAVSEVVVLAREDRPGDRRLVAYFVADEEIAPAELRAFLEARLPGYMVPAAYVRLDAMPLTPNGKIDRKALPAPEGREHDEGALAPRNPVEEVIAGIWADVLGMERVGVRDSFFEIGGHSLLATQVMGRIAASLSVELPLLAIFEAPTVEGLAARVVAARAAGGGAAVTDPGAAPIPRAPRDGALPLSFGQERLWFLEQLAPGAAYVVPSGVRLEGPLDVSALERALGEIVRRHEILRTTFVAEGGAPVQVIHAPTGFHLPVVRLAEGSPEEAVRRALAADATTPFDLREGPIFRAQLLELGPEDHVLSFAMHHVASDAWTAGLFLGELTELYAAFSAGEPSPLPELPIQYADYAIWQRARLDGAEMRRQLAYWRARLGGAPAALDLPADRPRPAARSQRGARRGFVLPPELLTSLRGIARREGATLFMVLLAAFDVLLFRWSGQGDVVVGTPIANRARPETERLLGLFMNTLALRVEIDGAMSFRAAIARARETALGAYANQDVPFEQIVADLAPDRDLSRSPLFQVMFTLQRTEREPARWRGLSASPARGAAVSSKLDLVLSMLESEGELAGAFEYATDLFDAATVERMIGHLCTLLEAAAATPDAPVGELPLMTPDERHTSTVLWNETAAPYPQGVAMHELVSRQAARAPDAAAVTCAGHVLTYGELERRAHRLAAWLRRRGVRAETKVATCLERSIETVIGLYGVLSAGGAYIALDPAHPRDRLAFTIEEAGAAIVLTQARLAPKVAGLAPHVLLLDADWAAIETEPGEPPHGDARPEHLAYVIYTSGSTGRPKGVEVGHAGLVNLSAWHARTYGLTAADRTTHLAAPGFDASVWEIWPSLMVGASLCVLDDETRASPAALVPWLVAQGVTVSFLPTPLAEAALLEPWPETSALRALLTGGDRLTSRPSGALPFRLFNHYGPTEYTVVATAAEVAPEGAGAPPIGKPIANTAVYVLDERLSPVPIGVPGELYLGGAGLSHGYLGRPDATAERFVPNPFAEGGSAGTRLYRTGDRVRFRASGDLEFLGRSDHQIKLRGFRIELGEIEVALTATPGVVAAIVTIREDVPGQPRLVAYVVADGHAPSPGTLRESLKERLPEYMVPSAFVSLPALPLTPNGKVDRRALPAPDAGAYAVREHVPPRGPVEETLAAIFAEVLQVPPERVGAHDGFFELGGHSLLATQAVARIRTALGVELPLRALFEAPSPAELALRVAAATSPVAPPITRVPPGAPRVPSFAEERLWFLDQLEPGNPTYVVPLAVRLGGALDVDALHRALVEIVRRHEVLRTTYGAQGGTLVPTVHPSEIQLPVEHLGDLSQAEREARMRDALAAEARRPFDLASGPVVRARLLALGEQDHVLLVALHHIVCDGWSLGVLGREIAALYGAFAGRPDAPSPLPELPVQYGDYAAWQRSWLSGEVLDRQLAFWKRQLAGAPRALDVPADRPRPPVPSHRGARHRFSFPAELREALQRVSREQGATLFMTLLAALGVLLGRYTGEHDLVVGTPIAGRTRAETEGLIGFFVNTLALRVDLSGDPTVAALVGRVKEACLGAYAHQDMPFERLVQELELERDPSRSPIFQVSFALQNVPDQAVSLPGLERRGLGAETGTAKFDLAFVLTETRLGLSGSIEYATDLFEHATVERMLAGFRVVCEGIAGDGGRRIRELAVLPEIERRQLAAWNDTTFEHPGEALIPALFAAQARRTPDAVAVSFEGHDLTYGELASRAGRLARELRRRGVGPEVLVGVCMERSLELLVALYGVLLAGGAYVPLDPEYPKDRLAFMLADCQPAVILTAPHLDAVLPEHGAPILHVGEAMRETGDGAALDGGAGPGNLAYVIYTSGSTGRPKGAMNEHRGIRNRLLWMLRVPGLHAGDRVLQKTPFTFDVSLWELFGPLLVGARLVVARPGGHREPAYLADVIASQAITLVHFVPSMLQLFLDDVSASGARGLPGSVRRVVCSGEALPAALAARFFAALPGIELHNLYGPTEAAVEVTSLAVDPSSPVVTLGRPLHNTRIHVLDASFAEVPIGVRGELYIAGVQVGRGYLRRPELTAERFVCDPFATEPGARMYRTGDVARWLPSGEIEYLGRADFQVKIRGFRIELGEIEAALGRHPSVREAVVMAREDSPGDVRLVAYLVCEGGVPAAAELRAFLGQSLPEHMVPSAFVGLDALPLTSSGKVDRRALPAPGAGTADARAYTAPRGPVEEALAGIFAEVLRTPPERVGAHDGFFELGGHSLLATQAVARIRAALGAELPLRALFEAPSPAELALRVAAATGPVAPPITRAPPGAPRVPSFAEERLWFLDQLEPGNPTYVVPLAVRLGGALDVDALHRALVEIVRRHEVLRTTFTAQHGALAPVVAAPELTLPIDRLDDLSEAEQEARMRREITAEARRPFDLAAEPPIRARILLLGERDHVLLVALHHIVCDGWSLGVLGREIAALYGAFAGRPDAPSPLPELPVQYGDYAAWQRAWLSGEVLDRQLAFWKGQLAGAPSALDLPTDRPRPPVPSHRGALQPLALPAELRDALQRVSREQGATLFMTLLAALAVLLGRYAGASDVVVGTPIAGRTRAETEGLIGFFVNTLALRADLSGDPTFAELVHRVKEACLGAYAHQDMPFERLVQEIEPERDPSRSPIFQVAFVLQNAPGETARMPGLERRTMGAEGGTAKFDLTFALAESPRGLSGAIEYATDLFDRATVERMAGHLAVLLGAAAAAPGEKLWALDLLGEDERRTLLGPWSGTRTAYPRNATIHALFAAQAAKTPESVAVVFEGERLSYRALDVQANRLAHRLRALGAGQGTKVGLYARRSLEMVVATLAILKAGGAYVPLDPDVPDARLAWVLEDAGAHIVVAAGTSAADRPLGEAQLVDLAAEAASLAAEPDTEPAPGEGSAESLAYVMYTSGSTGTPKGVCVPHRGVVRLVKDTDYARFGADEVFLQLAPIAFDAATLELWGPLLNGGKLVVFPAEPPSPQRLDEVIRTGGVTTLWLTAGLFNAVIDAAPEVLRPLRQLLTGGEALSVPHVQKALAQLPGVQLVNGYGPTEGTTFTCCHPIASAEGVTSIPIGRPIANTTVYVLDEHLAPVPIGVPGELYAGGDGVALGYLNRPDLDAERFVRDPFGPHPGARLYRTGDRVRWLADGTLAFLGRRDLQVKLRGYRIELGEIEAVLGACPGAGEIVVVVREDVPGDRRLVAYVAGGTAEPAALRAWLQGRLPDYMVPAAFVVLPALPLTPNGKVDRRALPAPEAGAYAAREHVPPRGPIEETLAGIFAEVLRFPTEEVGAHDGFFELGGHSLLATQAISRIRAALGVDLPLRALFETPSVAGLAARVELALRAGEGDVAPPLVRVPRGDTLPLSFGQERLWFLAQLAPDDPSYLVPLTSVLTGRLDRASLERALGALVDRHEVLRTRFTMVDGKPAGVVDAPGGFVLPVSSLLSLPAEAREAEARRAVAAESARPFDLAREVPIRARLFELGPDDHLLLVVLHHIATDGWSNGILLRELGLLYDAFTRGEPSPLPDLPIQYADYAAWQRAWLSGEVLERQLAYWRERLQGAPPSIDLPTDRPRPTVASRRGGTLGLSFRPGIAEALRDLSRRSGATLFMTLLTAFEALLHRYTGQSDIVVGTPIAGRTRAETEGLVGFFVNTLVLRVQLGDDPTFEGLLGRVKEASLGAYAHQDVPFERLVQELVHERDLGHSPLFQVLFTVRSDPGEGGALPALRTRPLGGASLTSKFDLSWGLADGPRGLAGTIEFARDLFDDATIGRMAGHFQILLEGIVQNPGARLSELPILTDAERRTLLVAWNDTTRPYPRDATIHALFAAQAAATPGATAVVFGGEQLSYRAIDVQANQLAHRLRGLGAGPGTKVALLARRSLGMVVATLAILKAGGAYVPLDPEMPDARLTWMLEDAGATVVVTAGAGTSGRALGGDRGLRFLDLAAEAASLAREPYTEPAPGEGSAEGLAYVMYTSGSTGTPKGVCVPHRAVVRLVKGADYARFGADEVFLQLAPIAFDAATLELWGPLLNGGKLVVFPAEPASPALLGDVIRTGGVTTLWLTAGLFNAVIDAAPEVLRPLRQLLTGGEALSVPHVQKALAQLPGVQLVNGYGPTEDTTFTCCHPIASAEGVTSIPIGRPITNTTVYVLDEHLAPVPIGVPGELYAGGDGVALGYLNRPDLDAERFVRDPFRPHPGARLYRTGDRVRWLADGTLAFLGRRDLQIKLRGYRIELGEIEAALAGHPAVREAAVMLRQDAPGGARLVAYLVAEGPPAAAELRAFLSERLPDYMVPAAFVALPALPLTPNGKVDRRALPVPEATDGAEAELVAPRTLTEQAIAGIWAEVLKLPAVGVTDDFFALGGHSLLAMQVVARLAKVLGVELPLAALFELRTVRGIAEVVDTVLGARAGSPAGTDLEEGEV